MAKLKEADALFDLTFKVSIRSISTQTHWCHGFVRKVLQLCNLIDIMQLVRSFNLMIPVYV